MEYGGQESPMTWSQVAGRNRGKKDRKAGMTRNKEIPPTIQGRSKDKGMEMGVRGQSSRTEPPSGRPIRSSKRPPKTAAVMLTCPEGQYAETIKRIRDSVQLEELGIQNVRPRRAITGAMIYEIGGEAANEKAYKLATKIRQATGEIEGVKVTVPTKKSELRLKDLDDAVDSEDVKRAVASAGCCTMEEIRVGPIRTAANGLGSVWIQCPVGTANKIAPPNKLRIGWTNVRVELLTDRPLQCFKCLELGHVQIKCPNTADRRGGCYRCGQANHKIRDCTAPPKCLTCLGKGLKSDHKTGGVACRSNKGGGVTPAKRREGIMGTPGSRKGYTLVKGKVEDAERTPKEDKRGYVEEKESVGCVRPQKSSTPMTGTPNTETGKRKRENKNDKGGGQVGGGDGNQEINLTGSSTTSPPSKMVALEARDEKVGEEHALGSMLPEEYPVFGEGWCQMTESGTEGPVLVEIAEGKGKDNGGVAPMEDVVEMHTDGNEDTASQS